MRTPSSELSAKSTRERGRSTRTTLAPRSARFRVALGPAQNAVRSRTNIGGSPPSGKRESVAPAGGWNTTMSPTEGAKKSLPMRSTSTRCPIGGEGRDAADRLRRRRCVHRQDRAPRHAAPHAGDGDLLPVAPGVQLGISQDLRGCCHFCARKPGRLHDLHHVCRIPLGQPWHEERVKLVTMCGAGSRVGETGIPEDLGHSDGERESIEFLIERRTERDVAIPTR